VSGVTYNDYWSDVIKNLRPILLLIFITSRIVNRI
jgi:hypothetical protein